jgi:hypothetical protein
MKRFVPTLALSSALAVSFGLAAQAPPPAAPAAKTMSQSLGLVVFPAKAQTAEVQNKDEGDCYTWAKQQTGYDPVAPPPAPTAAPVQAQKGGAVKGAARGAAGGAAIGAIAGDTGDGAAIGATVGAVKGRKAQKQQAAAAQQQSQQQATAAGQAQVDQYKKAFSACLEGKGYTVK